MPTIANASARFQQEARILSTLNHPNLMAIYDVGVQDGMHFLVSEFLEGETLRDRLSAGPLPQRRVVEYGLQIAKGLAAAHEKDIVHRDLKPENIFVLRDGRVKILDFGLAKQKALVATADATMTSPNQTSAGTVLGTAGYMSPEQVRGEAVDSRSDIFSLGTILYEMAAGKRAFSGDSSVEVMTSILKTEPPDLSESGTNVSVGLQRIVHRCLEKKPEARFQSASDLAFALDSLSSTGSTTSGGLQPLKGVEQKRSRMLLPALLLVGLAVGALATYFLYHPAVTHPEFTQISFRSAYIRHARFAPDGRTVVYDSTTDGKPTELFSTRTDTIEAQSLRLPASLLSISSTGELAVTLDTTFDPKYTPTGRLARVPLGGGSTREILDAVTDADWAADGSSLAVSHRVGHRFRLEFPPGKVLYQNDGYISDVCVSPAGDRIAFIDHSIFGDDRGTVEVVDLQGKRKVLTREFSSVQGMAWPPRGNEVWFTGSVNTEPNSLRAVTLDGKERVLLSSPVKLRLQDISKDGDVLLSVDDYRDQQLLAETASGKIQDISSFPFQITDAFSPDGKSLLLNTYETGGNSDYNLYTQRTDGSTPAMIGQGIGLTFSFDGKWVLALDPLNLKHMRVIPTGVGEARTLDAPAGTEYDGAAWLPDGKHVLALVHAPGQSPTTYLQDVQTGAAQKIGGEGRYLWTVGEQGLGSASPDGKSFMTTDGENHYWVQPMDGSAPTEIKGLSPGDLPLEWHGGSGNIFFERLIGTDTSEIYDLNLATGQSKLWSHFTPADKIAMVALRHPIITQDGAHALYVVQRIFSTLFVATGIH